MCARLGSESLKAGRFLTLQLVQITMHLRPQPIYMKPISICDASSGGQVLEFKMVGEAVS